MIHPRLSCPKLSFLLGGLMLAALVISAPAYAECGTQQQCIAVSINPLVAPAHGTPVTSAPLNFGSQPAGTTSADRTILVAAVLGTPTTQATLDAMTLGGANAAEFGISGGTCTVGAPSLVHDGNNQAQIINSCTITVTFNPTSTGSKSATLAVQTTSITRIIPLIGITGYPDLTQDATVAASLAAQTESAQRFSRTQIVNFQHRMESLHGTATGTTTSINLNAGAPAGVLIHEAVSLITTQSVNLANLTDQGAGGMPASTGLWGAGTANFGRRDATASRNGFRFSSDGISIGYDHRASDQTALGVGIGLARDNTDIGSDGSQNRAKGYSIAGYGSYHPGQKIFVDGMIGAGSLKFETQRYVSAASDYARSDRDGQQLFGSVATGYEYRDGGLLVSPYARVDYARHKLKQGTESGAGTLALSYASQSFTSLQGALGVRAESVHATRFGFAAPRIRAEYQHNFEDERQASVAYASPPGAASYAIPSGPVERNALILGVGNDFLMRNGAKFGVDYQILHTFSKDTDYAVLLQFAKDFNGEHVAIMPFSPLSGIQAEASYTFDDNVTRSNDSKLLDSSYGVNFGKTAAFLLTDHMRMLLTGSVAGERFHRYDGLSRLSGGVQGELQYRSSAHFSSPTWGVFLRTFADQYKSALRDGYRYSAGLSMRQPLTDRMRLFGALAHNRRNGKNAVFDHSDNAVRLNLDYELSAMGTLYLGGEYRRGDVVTTAASPGIYSANVWVQDDAFADATLFTYRLDGSTALATVGYNIGLGPRDSFDFSWRRIRSSLDYDIASILAGYTAASSYTSNQYSISYMMRF